MRTYMYVEMANDDDTCKYTFPNICAFLHACMGVDIRDRARGITQLDIQMSNQMWVDR